MTYKRILKSRQNLRAGRTNSVFFLKILEMSIGKGIPLKSMLVLQIEQV